MRKKTKKQEPAALTIAKLVEMGRAAREAMGEEKWKELERAEHARFNATMEGAARRFRDFSESPEGKAREAFRLRLEELRNDPAISRSETCLEVLEAFITCVTYRWGAKDAAGMIDLLAPHFNQVKAQKAAQAKLKADPKQDAKANVRIYWDRWRQQPALYASKAEFARDMLEKFDTLDSGEVITRWCRKWAGE